MKNLFVMLTLIVASAVSSTAEAALRLTLSDGVNPSQVYYFAANTGGTIDFSIGGFNGSADVIASNNPGQIAGSNGLGLVSQSLSLKTNGAVSGLSLTAVLDVIDSVAGVANNTLLAGAQLAAVAGAGLLEFTLPGLGPAIVRTQLTGNSQDPVVAGTAASSTAVDGLQYAPVTGVDILLDVDSNTAATLVTGPYTLSNTVVITGFETDGATSGQGALITSTSSIRGSSTPTNLVPEPTSMALAGFAGIGMAFGAIRRRRQVNQAA